MNHRVGATSMYWIVFYNFHSGNVFSCNKKNKGKERISSVYQAQYGAVYALQRNPAFPKVCCL